MAARSHDPKKFHGIGARVLRVPDAPVKFQGFRCNGIPVLALQRNGGKKKKNSSKYNRGPSPVWAWAPN